MLRLLRVILATLSLALLTLLFLDFTGSLHAWFGWLARTQYVPALLALNGVAFFALSLAAMLFGRVYCSLICPLGILQDFISWLNSRRGNKQRLRFRYKPARTWLRHTLLGLFIASFVAGFSGLSLQLISHTAPSSLAWLLEPYSIFGRIATHLFAPLWALGNNGLAWLAERAGSYAFYEVDVWVKSLPIFLLALGCFLFIAILAWRHGRCYCNTLCPVGTFLGLMSKNPTFGIRIDKDKCVSCGLCERQCKASCLDAKHHRVDHSRCVACMNCISACRKGAIRYGLAPQDDAASIPIEVPCDEPVPAAAPAVAQPPAAPAEGPADPTRRDFLRGAGIVLATAAAGQQEKLVDGGLAPIAGRKRPQRQTPILPPGARYRSRFASHCTGCQLCVSACPQGVLRPSTELERFMWPECSYERGYCPPECNKCSQVCPTDAIQPLSPAEKYSTQVGRAVWLQEHCVVLRDGVPCGACARHCPVGAITMLPLDAANPDSPRIPVVNEERCIGCGKCELHCPARPHSAIYVEGYESHRTL